MTQQMTQQMTAQNWREVVRLDRVGLLFARICAAVSVRGTAECAIMDAEDCCSSLIDRARFFGQRLDLCTDVGRTIFLSNKGRDNANV